jgi:PIN domain nuclease of toxin-antitoxin system
VKRVVAGSIPPEIASEAAGLRREGFHSGPADRLIHATARVPDAILVNDDDAIRASEETRPSRAARHPIW